MDFPTCPACKQSVLDDDAVNCPFCGSSMKAKPGAAKPAGSAVAAAPSKPAAGSSRVARPAPKPAVVDDAPLDFSDDFGVKATPASATRTKSRSFEVTCPMCETVGYVSPEAAGQSVKCANPKCLMPVFTAPLPEPVKVKAPERVKPKGNIVVLAGTTAAIMLVGGGVAYFVAVQPSNTVAVKSLSELSEADKELIKQAAQSQPPVAKTKPETKSKTVEPEPEPSEVDPKPAAEVSTAALLKGLNDASLQPRTNRSKPYCRRLTAEAFALAGDLPGAQAQLDALAKVGGEVPFYRVMPLVQIAWQQLSRGEKKAAAKTIDAAYAAAEKLPKTGRDRLESAISLAALLIAVNREADAQTLLDRHRTADQNAQLAQLTRAVQALGTFDLDAAEHHRPALNGNAPLLAGVVYELIGHQQSAKAGEWAANLADPRDRAEAVSAWVDGVSWSNRLHDADIPVAQLLSAAEALPAPGNVLALSRLGLALAWAGKTGSAEECLKRVSEAVAGWGPVAEITLPADSKELSQLNVPDYDVRSFETSAAAEAARFAAKLGQSEQADQLLTSALARARAAGPNPTDVKRRSDEVKSISIAALREKLKQEWKLKTANQAIVAATALQKNLDELAVAGAKRVDLQLQVLTAAIDWGLADEVWTYIRHGSTAEDAAQADNLVFTHLPSLLAEKFQATGNMERYELVTAAWKQLMPNRPLTRPFAVQFDEAVASDQPKELRKAFDLIKEFAGNSTDLDWLVLRGVCRLAEAQHYDKALNFASRLSDPVLKEECYLFIGGIAGRQGDSAAVMKPLGELTQASEKVALGRGLVGGRATRQ